MKILPMLRSSSAIRIAPLALGVVLWYYVMVGADETSRLDYGWAPTLVSVPLAFAYPFAYGVAGALGVWESGRLRRAAVWDLAPARSRHRVAAEALLPVVLVAWLMLVLPVSLALVHGGVVPDPASLGPLVLGLVLCVAHAVIGFLIGMRLPPVVAAPILAVVVWLTVATSRASEASWRRHTFGQYQVWLEFGEKATVSSLVAQALPTMGAALAVAALWLPVRRLAPRLLTAVALATVCAYAAYGMTDDWGLTPPLHSATAPLTCAGEAPRVCAPEATVEDIGALRGEVAATLDDLVRLGITGTAPRLVTDSLPDGRRVVESTPEVWRVGLTLGERDGDLRYRVTDAAMRFPCDFPAPLAHRAASLWVAERTEETAAYEAFLRTDPFFDDEQWRRLRADVDAVLSLPEESQLRWYRRTLEEACEAGA